MKKLFSFMLVMLFVVMSVTAFGAVDDDSNVDIDINNQYTTRFVVDKVNADDDSDTVQINLSLASSSGISAVQYALEYDSDVLVLEEEPVLVNDAFMFTPGPVGEDSHEGVLWSAENVYDTGVLVTYTFSINPEAVSGDYEVKLVLSEVLDDSRRPITTIAVSGGVVIPSYTVSYDANGGSGAPGSQNKSKNVSVFLSAVYPEKDGYRFVGWATDENASRAEYQPGDEYSENADLKLFAVWKEQDVIAGSIDVSVATETAKSGEEVEVAISVDNHEGFGGLAFDVIYDNSLLDYVSYEQNMTFNGLIEASKPETYENKVNFQILLNTTNATQTGKLVTLKFKVLDTEQDKKADISLVFSDAFVYSGDNNEEATLAANITNGGVEVFNKLCGDINLDDTVNSDDAMLLLGHFANGAAIDYKGSLDFNGDGEEDKEDATRLLQFSLFGDMFPIEEELSGRGPLVAETPETAKAVYTFGNVMGYTGENVEVVVSLKTLESLKAAGIAGITYNKDALTFNGCAIDDAFVSLVLKKEFSDMTFISAAENEFSEFDGALLRLSFAIKPDAVPGKYEITGVPAASKGDAVEAFAVPGSIEIKDISEKPIIPVSSVSFDKTSALIKIGETLALNVTVGPEDATDKSVVWKSSNENCATVDENGVVTAVAKGTAKITATSNNGKSATCTVTVGVPADTVRFTPLKFTSLGLGKSMSFKATASCENGTRPHSTKVVYEIVAGEEYATIDKTRGTLIAKDYGTVVVRATAEFGTETAYDEVSVKVCVPITKITLVPSKAAMAVGFGNLKLEANILPDDWDDTITFTSSNEEVARVDENGTVTAVAEGRATITALTGSGKKATCSITVGLHADKVEFTALKVTSVAVGKSLTLKAKAYRVDGDKPVSTAVEYEIVEEESDGEATIDARGTLRGVATGDVVVRARAEAGNAYEDVVINVCIPATKITLDKTKAKMIVGGEDLVLVATATPEGHTETITFTSSNEEIATVDENGVVTAHNSGTVKITAATGSGKKATCSITVGLPADKVEFTSLKVTSVAVGKSLTLKAKASRSDGRKPVSTNVVYEIIEEESDGEATIDARGTLRGIATGDVVVRARAEAGNAYEDVVINVCIPATKITLDKTKAAMIVGGEDLVLVATATPEGHTETITFTSSNEEIATVDENGVVTAHNSGTVKITAATGSGKKATCTVTIAKEVEFTSLKVTSVAVGKSLTLKAKAYRVEGEKIVSSDVVYEIVEAESDGEATIDVNGKLVGVAEGFVKVRARAEENEDAYEDVFIKVCVPATKVTLNKTKAAMAIGGNELVLTATLSAGSTDTVTFTSSNEEVASVDDDGTVTANAEGKATITALTGSGKKATCAVTVGKPADAVEITALKITSVAVGKSLTLKAKAYREDGDKPVSTAVEYEIVEEESDGEATIDAKGKLVAVEEGFVTVRVRPEARVEDVYADVIIKVCVPATRITLNTTKATVMLDEGELQLEIATVLPADICTDTFVWKTSNESVATVDPENGLVTVHKAGTAKISVTSGSGKSAYCTVTVTAE